MAAYNIYGHNNGNDDGPLVATIVLNANNTQVVSVSSDDPEVKAEAESVINDYIDAGLSAIDAIARYAGSYGDIKNANSDGTLVAAVEDEVGAEAEAEVEAEEAPTGSSTTFEIPDGIMAMTEEDGTVVTLLKRDPEHGAVYRHNGTWHPLVDPTVLDDLTFVGVAASAEGVYDKYEGDDKLVTIGHYTPSAGGPHWPEPVQIYDEGDESIIQVDDDEPSEESAEEPAEEPVEGPAEEPVAASLAINSTDDLTAAIAAAVDDPDLRWYVERRVEALGLEADLPWLKD